MLKELLDIEGKWFVKTVQDNLNEKGVSKSGRTAKSFHHLATEYSLTVWGRKDFHNVEKGVSPKEALSIEEKQFRGSLYRWAEYLPIEFETKTDRYMFAWNVSNKLRDIGSLLFREGGRTDIYTQEMPKLIERIKNAAAEKIMKIKIIEK